MNSTQQTTPGKPKFMGISDEVLTCECCGRTDLKRTIMISLDGDADPVHYGSECAARTLKGFGFKTTGKKVEKHAQQVERLVRETAFTAAQLANVHQMRNAGHTKYVIGGKEIGANLEMLDAQYTRELAGLRVRLEAVQTTLEVL